MGRALRDTRSDGLGVRRLLVGFYQN